MELLPAAFLKNIGAECNHPWIWCLTCSCDSILCQVICPKLMILGTQLVLWRSIDAVLMATIPTTICQRCPRLTSLCRSWCPCCPNKADRLGSHWLSIANANQWWYMLINGYWMLHLIVGNRNPYPVELITGLHQPLAGLGSSLDGSLRTGCGGDDGCFITLRGSMGSPHAVTPWWQLINRRYRYIMLHNWIMQTRGLASANWMFWSKYFCVI